MSASLSNINTPALFFPMGGFTNESISEFHAAILAGATVCIELITDPRCDGMLDATDEATPMIFSVCCDDDGHLICTETCATVAAGSELPATAEDAFKHVQAAVAAELPGLTAVPGEFDLGPDSTYGGWGWLFQLERDPDAPLPTAETQWVDDTITPAHEAAFEIWHATHLRKTAIHDAAFPARTVQAAPSKLHALTPAELAIELQWFQELYATAAQTPEGLRQLVEGLTAAEIDAMPSVYEMGGPDALEGRSEAEIDELAHAALARRKNHLVPDNPEHRAIGGVPEPLSPSQRLNEPMVVEAGLPVAPVELIDLLEEKFSILYGMEPDDVAALREADSVRVTVASRAIARIRDEEDPDQEGYSDQWVSFFGQAKVSIDGPFGISYAELELQDVEWPDDGLEEGSALGDLLDTAIEDAAYEAGFCLSNAGEDDGSDESWFIRVYNFSVI